MTHVIRAYSKKLDCFGYLNENGRFTAEFSDAERMTKEKGEKLMKFLRHKPGLHKLITVRDAVLLEYKASQQTA